jgi:hypothetical protein
MAETFVRAGLNRRKEKEQSTNAGRWLRRHLA